MPSLSTRKRSPPIKNIYVAYTDPTNTEGRIDKLKIKKGTHTFVFEDGVPATKDDGDEYTLQDYMESKDRKYQDLLSHMYIPVEEHPASEARKVARTLVRDLVVKIRKEEDPTYRSPKKSRRNKKGR
jgi:hypothetical protein